MTETDVEALLDPAARARLGLRKLLRLYLHPFALFKDASRGSALQQAAALRWNRRMRWMLLLYIRRWLFIASASFLGVAPAEALAGPLVPPGGTLAVLPAALLGAAFCLAFTVAVCAGAAYLLLSRR